MVSTKDQWFNPSDMLDLTGSDQTDMLYNQTMGIDQKSAPHETVPLPEEYFSNFLSSNYEEVDEFLTQELKDLDIPMIPERANYDASNDDLMNYDSIWNENNEEGGTPRKVHKRGPSGTAIFGFANHTKQLSISKMNMPTTLKPQNSDDPIPSVLDYEGASLSKDSNTKNRNLNSLILKQQEELRLALERQQEMNKKLEEQLRHSQLQQQQLQLALQEQEVATQQLSANTSPIKTPSSKASQMNDGNIIITSNSMTGSYQFPPPSMGRSSTGVISPISGTSINGSPSRKNQNSRAQLINAHGAANVMTADLQNSSSLDHFPNANNLEGNVSLEAIQKMSRYFESLGEQIPAHGPVMQGSFRKTFSNSPITPQQQIIPGNLSSTSSSPQIRKHITKDSITSSASTIPQLHDEDGSDTESGRFQKTIGLGIRFRNDNCKPKYTLNKPPHLDLLPTIPGSTDNTPAGKKNNQGINPTSFPQKHVFQHTPTKATINEQESSKDQLRQPRNIFGTLNEGLGPPLLQAEYDEDDPESEFIQAQTPSPILKSQGAFEGSSPMMESHHLSPMKITRKPTTLPPGEIDRYVKELADKTFECLYPQCRKNFKRRYNIRSHIQTHLEDRPYICDFDCCNKAFVRNHDLIRHKKTHAEKCYVCPCGKKFVREDALLVHRTRMICIGGKKFDNVVIKKSPRKRGRPRKDGTMSVSSSPIKDSIARDSDGTVALKMEEQLRRELIEHGLLNIPSDTVNPIERERLHVV